ncbi:unnamed protein product [Protopolystoma xenopodis]|uniref:Uncharacterized protein n=1 Tax=Protopolystoma xenopodis TaxID=117903 RepID=A0A448WV44_9PLAT|nr:unnamed protein product [Protopolystoma xenopodis]
MSSQHRSHRSQQSRGLHSPLAGKTSTEAAAPASGSEEPEKSACAAPSSPCSRLNGTQNLTPQAELVPASHHLQQMMQDRWQGHSNSEITNRSPSGDRVFGHVLAGLAWTSWALLAEHLAGLLGRQTEEHGSASVLRLISDGLEALTPWQLAAFLIADIAYRNLKNS